MSMNTYPLTEEAALVITPELAAIINSMCRCPGDSRQDPSEISEEQLVEEYGNVSEAYENLALRDLEGVYFCSEFEGTATHLDGNDTFQEQEDICYEDDYLCYIAPDRKSSLFDAAYRDMDELIKEFKIKLTEKKIDLRGFRLESCICSLSGTYFC